MAVHPQIKEYAESQGAHVVVPKEHRQLVESLFSVRSYWGKQTTVYLGDVYFTEETFRTIQEIDDQFAFFGDRGEIFAFKFRKDKRLLACIGHVLEHVNTDPAHYGMFWHLYRVMGGLDIDQHEIYDWPELRYIMIEDKTTDIDLIHQYYELLRSLKE